MTADLLAGRVEVGFVGARSPHPELQSRTSSRTRSCSSPRPRSRSSPPSRSARVAARLPRVEREERAPGPARWWPSASRTSGPLIAVTVALEAEGLAISSPRSSPASASRSSSRLAVRDELAQGHLRRARIDGVRILAGLRGLAHRRDASPRRAALRRRRRARGAGDGHRAPAAAAPPPLAGARARGRGRALLPARRRATSPRSSSAPDARRSTSPRVPSPAPPPSSWPSSSGRSARRSPSRSSGFARARARAAPRVRRRPCPRVSRRPARPPALARRAAWLARVLLNLMRSIPELVWALVFVRVGMGPAAGVTSRSASATPAIIGKVFAEIFESSPRAGRALAGAGAPPLGAFAFAVLPSALPLPRPTRCTASTARCGPRRCSARRRRRARRPARAVAQDVRVRRGRHDGPRAVRARRRGGPPLPAAAPPHPREPRLLPSGARRCARALARARRGRCAARGRLVLDLPARELSASRARERRRLLVLDLPARPRPRFLRRSCRRPSRPSP